MAPFPGAILAPMLSRRLSCNPRKIQRYSKRHCPGGQASEQAARSHNQNRQSSADFSAKLPLTPLRGSEIIRFA
jgi:hypothetical protein